MNIAPDPSEPPDAPVPPQHCEVLVVGIGQAGAFDAVPRVGATLADGPDAPAAPPRGA
ncbi:MAG TPA: hypothetical protein PLZ50_01030 [Rubrivivax sp.]|jgi:hypothetical protein|nr:hypothetical protein [Pseudomonadota bacterium]HOL38092.1 hypothetical protein [Rubrivivax sp.]HPP82131.1 hypothetical protein [Rubrivivax sp.]